MSTIVLKTAKRNTTVSRIKVRQAVAAIYDGKIVLPVGQTKPVIKIKKKSAVKKTFALK